MRHLRVDDSSNVLSVAYDPAKQTLDVEFAAGSTYRYANVQPHQFGECAGAQSVGKWVQATLVRSKAGHPFTKLDAATRPPETKLARMRVALEMIASIALCTDLDSYGEVRGQAESMIAAAQEALK